jgi:nucleoside-diphosphate-sugar epimerase
MSILITGSTGYLGSLVVATALRETDDRLVLPVRAPHTADTVIARIAREAAAGGHPLGEGDVSRLIVVGMPPPERLVDLAAPLAALDVREIIHCAGCVSYFHVRRLQSGNVELTRALVALGTQLGVRRFVFVSTAYACGIVDGPIPETLHDRPGSDPTDYTRTKRDAEWLVARSGLPFMIVRPSIVIGDSRDGRYRGRPYGPYQLWTGLGRYLGDGFPPVLHVVAPREPLNFLHQDAFTTGFWACHRSLPDGAVVHLASREDGLPTMRDLWCLWLATYGGPEEIHLYERRDDVPLADVDARLKLWLDFTAVNSDIASVRWRFALDTLERLRRAGAPPIVDATLDTMRVVQDRFVRDTPALQRFVAAGRGTGTPRFVAHPRAA